MLSSLSPCSSPPLFPKSISSLNPNPRSLSFLLHCSNSTSSSATSTSPISSTSPVRRKRERYRKPCPGESKGICEEMRFVAMRLRNDYVEREAKDDEETWKPSMEGFLKYLVDSKLVFDTVERIINESSDVAYVYFRKNGLERTDRITKDLEWFKEQGFAIPDPSSPGISYSTYLKEMAETTVPSFLCHYYSIFFAHATGGVGIGQKVCQMLLEGRELEFHKWDGDVQILLKDVRESLNKLGAHWSRDEKNKCLREASKSFCYLGSIVRLIIML